MDTMEGNIAVFNMGRHLALRPLVNDLLPYPANLHRWSLVEDPNFHMCNKADTMQHALSSYHTARAQGRYRWRYDTVPREM